MAVMEVNLPSGYIVDIHSLPSLEISQNVQKVESKNKFTKVILYFNNISNVIEFCPTISAFRIYKVANHRPVPVVLYDYYDTCKYILENIFVSRDQLDYIFQQGEQEYSTNLLKVLFAIFVQTLTANLIV